MKKTCEVCAREFVTFPSHVAKGYGRFCSLKCKGKSERSGKSIGEVDGFNCYVGTNGYVRIVLGRSNEKLLHVYIMEKHLGREINGSLQQVHHIDGDIQNNALSNLRLLTHQQHKQLHLDQKVTRLGGDPIKDKYCPRCKSIKPRNEFHVARSNLDGLYGFCKECACRRVRENKRRKREEALLRL